MVSKKLLNAIIKQYSLPLEGLHGLSHWARVLENGRLLAPLTGARLEVVELFAVFHDARRRNESTDYRHGHRAADYVRAQRHLLDLNERDFDLLVMACAYHVDGGTIGDVTVQTCWDADRLDICRVGLQINPKYLCTEAAREETFMREAVVRGVNRYVPELIKSEWGVEL
ncbi:MAG: hypothetical protein JXB07_14390 [Anaerolineae bacterium]|nr:hypothetical protein [Anaerolineae bacterium]